MIVDDSRIVYVQMQKMLEETEYEIVGYCRTGEEALEQYDQLKPDVVTMDIVMPGIDGLETCRRLLEKWPDAKVVVVSSLAYDDTINTATINGAKGFLFKPFTKESLIESIESAATAEAEQAQ
jgi:two-component system chemotaxis response regulator CheY